MGCVGEGTGGYCSLLYTDRKAKCQRGQIDVRTARSCIVPFFTLHLTYARACVCVPSFVMKGETLGGGVGGGVDYIYACISAYITRRGLYNTHKDPRLFCELAEIMLVNRNFKIYGNIYVCAWKGKERGVKIVMSRIQRVGQ